MLAIEPSQIDWGEQLTSDVAAAVPAVAQAIRDLVQEWLHET
jgi:hypothetical protein